MELDEQAQVTRMTPKYHIESNEEIEVLRKRLKDRQGVYHVVAINSGVSYSWVSKFANGHIIRPSEAKLIPLKRTLDMLDRAS